jgi:hypothetical protein
MVAKVLDIDIDNNPEGRAKITQILKTWFKNGVLDIEERQDENRHKRKFVVPVSSTIRRRFSWQPSSGSRAMRLASRRRRDSAAPRWRPCSWSKRFLASSHRYR